ncbi:sugar phosphate isomerase/epimerase [Mycolicibacterium cosmeticum]|uniref:Sugar phosphate isomerase/epimerase n=2 Tax=Mycolicibacterium cosmeticum TaxID=258533 RepID=W9ATL8_MYCCO|nr:sugar phosphate isomerase/epimerase [Mycolicibacterium cosmeticum]TLH67004.1 sugar phosphate isomerase/epimerase [Mycolicibacterium cosmeticum]CDO05956.1 sugar phosphate isomerase/epimerase [Mycolicibacterium cosmeticum]
MTDPRLVATAWTSAGDTSPMRMPATSLVPIAERVAAIADSGYVGLGLITDDLLAVRDSLGFAGLRDLIYSAGLTHIEIELLERWWLPRTALGNSYDVRALLFEAADVLQPAFIRIGSELGPRTGRPEALAAPLRELGDQAAEHGTRIAMETMPFSIVSTVPLGAEIVAAAGHPAVGLLVDAWHVFRAGTSLDQLRAALTPEMIFGVELDDASAVWSGSLFEDTVNNRLLCGEGSFDLHGLVALLRDLGFDGPWGVEILSESFRALPVREALKLAADSAYSVL